MLQLVLIPFDGGNIMHQTAAAHAPYPCLSPQSYKSRHNNARVAADARSATNFPPIQFLCRKAHLHIPQLSIYYLRRGYSSADDASACLVFSSPSFLSKILRPPSMSSPSMAPTCLNLGSDVSRTQGLYSLETCSNAVHNWQSATVG